MTSMPHPLTPANLLLTVWHYPPRLLELTPPDQNLTLRLTRQTGILGNIATRLQQTPYFNQFSPHTQNQLEAACRIAQDRERTILWEINRIQRAFFGTGLPLILLKGAAYHLLQLPNAQGRLTGDVDLLLPDTDLPQAENILKLHGWQTAIPNNYDQYYYRKWMHELPPMIHQTRYGELDLHHNLLPPTSHLSPNATLLLHRIQPVPNREGIWTLCPEDMILHTTLHLFHDGDFQRMGLRDLLDLHTLLTHFASREYFWHQLLTRSRELNLTQPLALALHCLTRLTRLPVPAEITNTLNQTTNPITRYLLTSLITQTILPHHPDASITTMQHMARWILYARSHWLRMPLKLLLPHLARKWARQWSTHVRHRRIA